MSLVDLEMREARQPMSNKREAELYVVWGPAGSGKTLVAINLAFELASLGQRVVLVDASIRRPAIAPWLGITDPGPGILAQLRLARQERLDHEQFQRLSHEIAFEKHSLRLITGMNQTNRWPEFDELALANLLTQLSTNSDLIVLDLDSDLEGGLVSLESSVGRNEPTRWLLAAASKVIAITNSDPVGVNHFLSQVRELDVPYELISNRLRSSVLGRDASRQIRDTFYQFLGKELIALLPDDPAAVDASLLRGQPLLLASKNSKLREALRGLAVEILK